MKKLVILSLGLFAIVAGIYLLRSSHQTPDLKEDVKADSLLTYSPAGPARTISLQAPTAPTEVSAPVAAETKPPPELSALLDSYQKAFATADYKLGDLYSNLVQQLKSDPAKMAMVVDWMKSGTNAELTANLSELICKNCGQAGSTLLEKTALDLAKDSGSSAHRTTAVSILSTLTQPDADTLQTAGLLAQSDDDPKVRSGAIDALGKWLTQSKDPEMQGNLQQQIVTAINSQGADDKLRSHAFTYLANQTAPFSADILQTIPSLQQQSDPQIRQMTATVLGQASDGAKDYAMQQLEQGLANETDADAKRVIASQIVRLGKNDGLSMVRQIAANDPDLIQQMEGYLQMVKQSQTGHP